MLYGTSAPWIDNSESKSLLYSSASTMLVTPVKDMIIEGELARGTQFHEIKLGTCLGISWSLLRAAHKFLINESLVELSPGRSAIVWQFGPKDAHSRLVVVAKSGGVAGHHAYEKAADTENWESWQLHDHMMGVYVKRGRLSYFNCNQNIYSALLQLSKNETPVYMHGNLRAQLRRILYVGTGGPQKQTGPTTENEEITDAMGIPLRHTSSRIAGAAHSFLILFLESVQ